MKKIIQIILVASLSLMSATAQDQKGINPPEKNPEMLKINEFLRYDSDERPFSDEEIQKFCDYIKGNSIVKESQINNRVPIEKIRAATYFYKHTNDENQKKKILDLMMNMFTEIQTARDALGVDPLSRTESWLYVDPSTPRKDPSEFKDLAEQMVEGQRRLNESNSRRNKLSERIGELENIHAYLHRAITVHMKVSLPGISPTLERSPAEKARTEDLLEAQAAALGRKKPEPKRPTNDGK